MQLVEHTPPNLGSPPGRTEDLKNGTCALSSLVLGDDDECKETVQAKRIVLPLARHQCSIHCESSCVAK